MRVKNINGTKDNTCKCGSWLEHWKKYSGETLLNLIATNKCAESNCSQFYEVGAHVQKDNSSDNSWYIIPLCKTHNNMSGKSIDIRDNVKLVSANVSITCGK